MSYARRTPGYSVSTPTGRGQTKFELGTHPRKGDIYYDGWGYDQTQNDFVEVTGLTPSGKSAVVKRIGKKDAGESVVAPDQNATFGPEFKLKIGKDDLRGSYPYVWGYPDSKRKGFFTRYTGTPVYETPPGMGH
jgi:hypothetical protein